MKLIHRLSVSLVLISCASGLADSQQKKSEIENSYLKAREVLTAGIEVMGGLESLQKIEDVTRVLSGIRADEGQGMAPVLPRVGNPPATNHPKIKSVRDIRGQRTFDETEDVIFGGQPIKVRSIIAGTTAFSVFEITKNLRVPTASVNALRAGRFRRYPETLMLAAWNQPETLRWQGVGDLDGRPQSLVSFADVDGTEVTMYFDSKTGLLTKTELLSDDQVLGDITLEAIYSDWRRVVERIIPVHGRMGTMDDLEQALANWSARK